MIVRPYKLGFMPALFLMLFGTNFLIFITYMPLNFLYELAFPPKQYKKADEGALEGDKIDATANMEQEKDQMEKEVAAQKAQNLEGMEGEAVDLEAYDNADK